MRYFDVLTDYIFTGFFFMKGYLVFWFCDFITSLPFKLSVSFGKLLPSQAGVNFTGSLRRNGAFSSAASQPMDKRNNTLGPFFYHYKITQRICSRVLKPVFQLRQPCVEKISLFEAFYQISAACDSYESVRVWPALTIQLPTISFIMLSMCVSVK